MRLSAGRTRRHGLPSRESWGATARRLRGPLYAAEGAGTAHQGGFGRSGSGRDLTVSASIRHVGPWGELDVETSDEEPWGDASFHDYRLAMDWVHRALRPDGVRFPLALTAARWEREVLVDGEPWSFVFVGDENAWCAAGSVAGRSVRVSATGSPHDRLALVTVPPSAVSDEVPERP